MYPNPQQGGAPTRPLTPASAGNTQSHSSTPGAAQQQVHQVMQTAAAVAASGSNQSIAGMGPPGPPLQQQQHGQQIANGRGQMGIVGGGAGGGGQGRERGLQTSLQFQNAHAQTNTMYTPPMFPGPANAWMTNNQGPPAFNPYAPPNQYTHNQTMAARPPPPPPPPPPHLPTGTPAQPSHTHTPLQPATPTHQPP
ncbi:unnamed protein product [Vitrella brassicaformis CCMP3155]|uniref:Uncharacterized protein n=2 Tax=Vitrella brassicaformis TaxID=1169539 RepID=A0A0G4H389_VITBC|nr:unnamed protein product [Vitrella brassicaformis CCMP3155]|eukprot:CEM38175.1 unnamed protein product [Vitrella brassicaformis CCMP3155]